MGTETLCVHCGLPIHKAADDDNKDWRHVGSGSIFCKKKRGMTLMDATPTPERISR
jgi:hypothetical protein